MWSADSGIQFAAEYGTIAAEGGACGSELAGRTAEGYFDLLFDWTGRQRGAGASLAGGALRPAVVQAEGVMDEDLEEMTRTELLDEARKLRQGIREHRDSSMHALCWHHPALWALLPDKSDPVPVVPEWPEFLKGCIRYRQSLDEQAPQAPRTSRPYEER